MISRHSRTGLTIWEVVAILAIIVITAAILFPVFQKTRSGGGPSCQSNMKQLGLALVQYEQDSDETLPAGVNAAGNGWAGELYSYVKSTRTYHCPKDEHDGPFISYAENQNLVKQTLADFSAPAATVELYEFTTLNCDPSSGYPTGMISSAPGSFIATGPMETTSATGLAAPQNSMRHDPETFALNFLAVDGHVRWLTPVQVSNGPQAVSAKRMPHGLYRETFAIQ